MKNKFTAKIESLPRTISFLATTFIRFEKKQALAGQYFELIEIELEKKVIIDKDLLQLLIYFSRDRSKF